MAYFSEAIDTVLGNEGGLVDDPNDKGGLTKFGISQRSYPDLDIRNLTVEDARAIYLKDFWRYDGILNQAVATKLFDAAVNMGRNAIKIIQRLLSLTDDGIYGPKTEKAINGEDPALLLSRYRIALIQHYIEVARENPAEAKYLQGWLRRARQ